MAALARKFADSNVDVRLTPLRTRTRTRGAQYVVTWMHAALT